MYKNFELEKAKLIETELMERRKYNISYHNTLFEAITLMLLGVILLIVLPFAVGIYYKNIFDIIIFAIGATIIMVSGAVVNLATTGPRKNYNLNNNDSLEVWKKDLTVRLPVLIKKEGNILNVYDKKSVGDNSFDYAYEVNKYEMFHLLKNISTGMYKDIRLSGEELEKELAKDIEKLRVSIDEENKLEEKIFELRM